MQVHFGLPGPCALEVLAGGSAPAGPGMPEPHLVIPMARRSWGGVWGGAPPLPLLPTGRMVGATGRASHRNSGARSSPAAPGNSRRRASYVASQVSFPTECEIACSVLI